MRILLAAKRRSDIATKWRKVIAIGRKPSSLPTSFDLAPLALVSGRGAGGEGVYTVF